MRKIPGNNIQFDAVSSPGDQAGGAEGEGELTKKMKEGGFRTKE